MVRNARKTLVEQKKESSSVKKSKIEVVILGIDEGEGTVNDILTEVCKDLKIKCTSINVREAWISDQDIEKGTLVVSNYDGKDSKITIKISESVVFVRRGAIMDMTGQALTSLFETAGCFMVNDLDSMLLCDNKMATAIQLSSHNIDIPKIDFIVPSKSLLEVSRILPFTQDDVSVFMTKASNQVIFKMDNYQLTTTLTQGNFPDFNSLIPDSNSTSCIIPKINFKSAVRSLGVLAKDGNGIIRLEISGSEQNQNLLKVTPNWA